MEAIKTRGVAKDGLLTVHVPHKFDEQELEVIVLSKMGNDMLIKDEPDGEDMKQSRINRLMNIVGTAKYPDAPIDKYDEYDQ